MLTKHIRSKFEVYWLKQINTLRIGPDGNDHNKLRTYKLFKGSFRAEPYIEQVINRNQRSFLTRLRISALTSLGIEKLRYSKPPVPVNDRICIYCHDQNNSHIDDERHIFVCPKFKFLIECFKNKMSLEIKGFCMLSENEQFLTCMCPTSAQQAKAVNRFIKITFESRENIDNNKPNAQINPFLDQLT